MIVLDELEKTDYIPDCVITTPDKPKGRKLVLTPTLVKDWAIQRKIKVYDPAKLDAELISKLNQPSVSQIGKRIMSVIPAKAGIQCGRRDEKSWDMFIVASYGKIIPNAIINIPRYKTLNIHPSLLPKYRGASPLQSAILDDSKQTGVSIMRIDEEMDHGPIVAQENVNVNEWPIYEEFEEMMAKIGGRLLVKIIPLWIAGEIKEREQVHGQATYTKKINKGAGLIELNDDPYLNFRKIQAFHEWPQAYFLIKHDGKEIRVKITKASFENSQLKVQKVIPEGGKEMPYEDFLRGYRKSVTPIDE